MLIGRALESKKKGQGMTLSNDLLDRLVITTTSHSFLDWLEIKSRETSPWVFPFGLSCCSLEQAAAFHSAQLITDNQSSPIRVKPEEADIMIFGGSVTAKVLPILTQIHGRLKEPKWVMSIGACAASGGLYADGYSVMPGLSQHFPIDVYVPGCPPSPNQVFEGLELLKMRMGKNISRWLLEQESLS